MRAAAAPVKLPERGKLTLTEHSWKPETHMCAHLLQLQHHATHMFRVGNA